MGNTGNAASGTGNLNLSLQDYLNSGMQNVNHPTANPGDWGQAVTGASNSLQAQILDYLKNAGYNTGVNVKQVGEVPVPAAVSTRTGSDNPTSNIPQPFVPQVIAQPVQATVDWAKKRLGL